MPQLASHYQASPRLAQIPLRWGWRRRSFAFPLPHRIPQLNIVLMVGWDNRYFSGVIFLEPTLAVFIVDLMRQTHGYRLKLIMTSAIHACDHDLASRRYIKTRH